MWSYLKKVKGHSGYWSCERCIQKGERCVDEDENTTTQSTTKPATNKKGTIQFKDLNASPTLDEDFLSYTKRNDSPDGNINNINDLSPFFTKLNFPMISGFIIDTMHTMYAGCFSRRLEGLVEHRKEGKLSHNALSQIDERLKLFASCKPFEFDRTLRSLTRCYKK